MKISTLIFIALALLQAYRFKVTRQKWRVPMALFWCALAGYSITHSRWLVAALLATLAAALWLKSGGIWPLQLTIDRLRLRRLSPEEEDFRRTLTKKERESLEFRETVTKQRYDLNETRDWVALSRQIAEEEKAAAAAREAEDADEHAEEEALEAENREMNAVGLIESGNVRFELKRPTTIHTPEGEQTIPPGEYSGTVSLRPNRTESADDSTPVECIFEFTQGDVRWRTITWLGISSLSELQRPELAEKAVFWTDTPRQWKAAFQTRCLLADVTAFDDGRERFDLWISGSEFCVMTKYLTWQLALALSGDGCRLFVRVHALESEVWKDGDSSNPDREFVDFRRVPPFCAELPIEALLPITEPDIHAVERENDWENETPIQFTKG